MFGPVNELLSEADDALAIIGPGEEVHLEFALPETELREGWTRCVVLESVGWCKDMDLYTRDVFAKPCICGNRPFRPRIE